MRSFNAYDYSFLNRLPKEDAVDVEEDRENGGMLEPQTFEEIMERYFPDCPFIDEDSEEDGENDME